MKMPKPVTVDFETFGIEDRPHYPPVPVGVSIKLWGKKAHYYAWGHVEGNNCTWKEARQALLAVWNNKEGLLFQHGSFDIDVAVAHMDLEQPPWHMVHDTMFLLFLDDPHQQELDLKSSAERLLDWPAEERDEVVEWLVANQPVPGVKISRSKQSDTYAMKFFPYVPVRIAAPYANGDSDRTEGLFKLLWPSVVVDRAMGAPYDRERRLAPILLDMERAGLPVDLPRLRVDVERYSLVLDRVETWLRTTLKAPTLNIDSGQDLVAALVKAGKADEDLLPLTAKTRKPQTNKEALLLAVTDKSLLAVLKYRAQLKTCLNTFMGSWLRQAELSGGFIYTRWNQTRASSGDANVGTRTGRLSATWFMNMPKEFTPIFAHEEADRRKAKALPKCPIKDLPSLPQVRSYVVPFKGEVLIDRDYSQQEPRILAHFDGGALLENYLLNPWLDLHDYARDELALRGRHYERRPVKNTNLGLMYGMGVGKLAEKNDMTTNEAGELKKAILDLYPGLKDMYKDMKVRAKHGTPIRTWGGREYYCEPARYDEKRGRWMEYDYKLVNVLIQGSAADCTKEAIIRFDDARDKRWRLLLNVHDQLTASVPPKDVHRAMACLKKCMESVEFDVPMLSEGSTSSKHWNDLKDYDKKGVRV